jgi:hypothetical protein
MVFWEEDTNLEKSEKITEKIKEKSGKKCYFSSQRSERFQGTRNLFGISKNSILFDDIFHNCSINFVCIIIIKIDKHTHIYLKETTPVIYSFYLC